MKKGGKKNSAVCGINCEKATAFSRTISNATNHWFLYLYCKKVSPRRNLGLELIFFSGRSTGQYYLQKVFFENPSIFITAMQHLRVMNNTKQSDVNPKKWHCRGSM